MADRPAAAPAEAIRETAVLLAAADHALLDDMSADRAVEFARQHWEALNHEPWAGGKHSGDCTKTAHTCARCMAEDYEREARERWDS